MNMLDQFQVGALIALAVSDGPADYDYVINTTNVVSRVPTMTYAADSLVKLGLATLTGSRLTLTGQAFRDYPQLKLFCSQFYKDGLG